MKGANIGSVLALEERESKIKGLEDFIQASGFRR